MIIDKVFNLRSKGFHKPLFILILFICFSSGVFSQAPNITYSTPKSYVVNTTITALSPTNTGGAVPATIYGQVSNYAGGTSILLTPTGIAIDATGNMFIESWGTNQILKRSPAGTISVFAGSGAQGATNGQGTAASFYEPDAIIIDAAGNIIVADQGNNLIRKITPGGLVSTFAGSGALSSANGTGTAASFNNPRGMAIDAAGNIYVADQGNNLIRKITPAGVVTTYAGTGGSGLTNGAAATASFSSPCGIGIDAAGNLYIGDSGNNVIRKITTAGVVSTFATGFNFPREIRVDGTGNLYVCDQNSNSIKRVSPTGVVTTLSTSFGGPIGLLLDGLGNLFIGDIGSNLVKKMVVSGYTIDKSLPPGLSFDQTTGIITGKPTAVSPQTFYTITAYNGGGSSTTVVSITVTLTVVQQQSIITFNPPDPSTLDANNDIVPGATSTNNETPITYTSSDLTVATITPSGKIHIVGPGVANITANQAGNVNYLPATSVYVIVTVTDDQKLTFPVIAVKKLCDADFSANVTSTNGTLPITYASSNTLVATINSVGIIHIVGPGSTTITANQAGNNLYNAAPQQSQVLTVAAAVVPLVAVAPNVTSLCSGSTVTYTATVSNVSTGLTYQWLVNNIVAGSNSNTLTYPPLASADVVKCLVTNTNSCNVIGTSNSYSGVVVNSFVVPGISISTPTNTSICNGTAITFTANATFGTVGQVALDWQVNGVSTGTTTNIFSSSNLNDADVVSCVAAYSGYACFTAATATSNSIAVSIITPASPPPSVIVTSSANNVYVGTAVTFTATPLNAGNVSSYQWQINGKNVGNNSPTYTSSILKTSFIVTCTIVSDLPCTVPAISDVFTETILPLPDIIIPNTFTPNGDSINDTWNITNLVYYPNSLVSVYNRNGKIVYQSRQYQVSWDGSYQGHPLPFGSYYYIIDLPAQGLKMSGSVTIVR